MDLEHIDVHCSCHSPEHTLQFMYDPDYNDLYIWVYLISRSFFRRLWIGLKYIVGRSGDWHFEECMFNPKDASKMIDLFTRSQNEHMRRNGDANDAG